MSQTKRDRIIDAMWQNLPQACIEDLRHDVEIDLGEDVSYATISQAIVHLRRNSATYGWTIPHSKRGPVDSAEKRLIGMKLKNPVINAIDRAHAQEGAAATLKGMHSAAKHQAATLDAMMSGTASPRLKAVYKQIRNEQLHIANLAETALEALAA